MAKTISKPKVTSPVTKPAPKPIEIRRGSPNDRGTRPGKIED